MFGLIGAFDTKHYGKIYKQSVGRSVGFLVVLALIISAVLSVRYSFVVISGFSAVRSWAHSDLGKIASEFPAVEVDKGVLVEPKGSFTKDLGGKLYIVIEPDPEAAKAVADKYENLVLLTQKKFLTKQTAGRNASSEVKTYDLQEKSFKLSSRPDGFLLSMDGKTFALTPQVVDKWFRVVSWLVYPFMLIILWGIYAVIKPLHVFIFSLVSWIICLLTDVKLSYKELWNIGSYAIVPAVCVAVLVGLTGKMFAFFPAIYILLYIAYLYLAVKSVKAEISPRKE